MLTNIHLELAQKEWQARNVTCSPRDGIAKLRNLIKDDKRKDMDEDMRGAYGLVPKYESVAAWKALNA